MSTVYWILVVVAALSIVLGIVEHFGVTALSNLGVTAAFSAFANNCLLLAIALAVGKRLCAPVGKEPSEGKPSE